MGWDSKQKAGRESGSICVLLHYIILSDKEDEQVKRRVVNSSFGVSQKYKQKNETREGSKEVKM